MKILYFITGNKGKLVEVQEKFDPLGITVIQKDMGYPEIQADSLEEVVHYGIENLQGHFSKPFLGKLFRAY